MTHYDFLLFPIDQRQGVCYTITRFPTGRLFDGDIAQLVERLNGIEKVRGSTPLISTIGGMAQW